MEKFIPDCQYGFIKGTGTNDYGAALALTMQTHLDSWYPWIKKCWLHADSSGLLVSMDKKMLAIKFIMQYKFMLVI